MNCRYVSTNLRLNHLSLIQFMIIGCRNKGKKNHHKPVHPISELASQETKNGGPDLTGKTNR
jgi:hypothetical protein